MGLTTSGYVLGSGMCTQWSFLEKVSDHRGGCGVLVLTWPISLAFDRYYLLLLAAWSPPTMKLNSWLAF
jgi:hypothetical protein